MSPRICLFDIDGTLLNSGGAGQTAMERALAEVFQVQGPHDDIPAAGRTDRAITQDLFAHLVVSMDKALTDWDQGRGLAAIREAWLARADGIGKPVTVNLPDRQIHGLFDGIDGEGRLMLVTPDGKKQMIASGDVFFC